MNNTIGIYEKALLRQPLEKSFADAASAGFDNFQISIDETDERLARLDWDAAAVRALAAAARRCGVTLTSVCLSAHRRFALGSADAANEARAQQIMSKAMDFCLLAGIPMIQVAGYDVFYEPESAATAARWQRNLAAFLPRAERENLTLAIEPVETGIISAVQAQCVAKELGSPALRVYPDTANLYMMGFDVLDELSQTIDCCSALHVREAPDDEYIPFGEGKLDWDAVFDLLAARGFAGPLTIELWNLDNPDYLTLVRGQREFLQRKLSER